MKTIRVEIRGVTPLLLHRFNENAEQQRNTRKIKAESLDPRAEAEKVVYRNEDGTFYFPAAHITGCLGNAGSNHKMRGSRKSVRFVVPAAVRTSTDAITILNGSGPATSFEVDARPVTIPSTKGKVMRYRPRFNDWGAAFDLVVNENLLDIETVHQLLNEGGLQYGIGDYRPETRGPFGTFLVTKFDESND